MDQNKRVPWLRLSGALVPGFLLLAALLPNTGGIIAGPPPTPKMLRCGPFLFYPGAFFGLLGTIMGLTAFTILGIVRQNACEFIGWVLLALVVVVMCFA